MESKSKKSSGRRVSGRQPQREAWTKALIAVDDYAWSDSMPFDKRDAVIKAIRRYGRACVRAAQETK